MRIDSFRAHAPAQPVASSKPPGQPFADMLSAASRAAPQPAVPDPATRLPTSALSTARPMGGSQTNAPIQSATAPRKPETAGSAEAPPSASAAPQAVRPLEVTTARAPVEWPDAKAAPPQIAVEATSASASTSVLPASPEGLAAQQSTPARAFGLDELGMFGLHAAFAARAAVQAPRIVGAERGSAAPATISLLEAEGQALASWTQASEPPIVAAGATPAAASEAAGPSSFAALITDGRQPTTAVVPSAGGPLGEVAELATPSEAAAGGPENAPIPATRENSKPDIVILASGPDEALQVVVAISGGEGAPSIQLREAAEQTAAEFGLRIAELSANGRKISATEVGLLGASNGRS